MKNYLGKQLFYILQTQEIACTSPALILAPQK